MELYLHIPFCVKKCNYCDFLSFPSDSDTMNAYARALQRDIAQASQKYGSETITSVFFGGGTPSILPDNVIPQLMRTIRSCFLLPDVCEITVECNPGTLTADKLQALYDCGVNRLSFGVQSANEEELGKLGRIHTFAAAEENFHLARSIGFTNISIDIMMALPGQSLGSYERTLRKIIELNPEHISAYDLIIEEGTCFFEWFQQRPEDFPTEELSCEMYRLTQRILKEAGYEQYEISNYAKDGYFSRHNYGYWSNVPYLGLGLGASSYIGNRRFRNTDDMKEYLIQNKIMEENILSEREQQEEFFILGLRRREGISKEDFLARFSENVFRVYEEVLEKQCQKGLMEKTTNGYRLSERGILLSNTVFVSLMEPEGLPLKD